VVNLGYWLAQHGWRTVLFEVDHQADLPKLMGVDGAQTGAHFLDRVLEELSLDHFVQVKADKLFVLPGNMEMASTASVLNTNLNLREDPVYRRKLLDAMGRRMYEAGDQFDIILVDPPKSGPLQHAALTGAELLIIPFMLDLPSITNAAAFIDFAHLFLPADASIALLPIGVPMGKDEDGNAVAKPIKVEREALFELRQSVIQTGREVHVAEGIPFRKRVKTAAFKGKIILEYPTDLAAVCYDRFCHQMFGV
jgi:cellulose biosynthesis protein BcsQ